MAYRKNKPHPQTYIFQEIKISDKGSPRNIPVKFDWNSFPSFRSEDFFNEMVKDGCTQTHTHVYDGHNTSEAINRSNKSNYTLFDDITYTQCP